MKETAQRIDIKVAFGEKSYKIFSNLSNIFV